MMCFSRCCAFGAALLALGLLMIGAETASANVLANPGFETDAVFGAAPVPGATGWTTFGNSNTASDPNDPVRSGIGSLQLAAAGGFSVPGAFQTFPASAGQSVDFQGYMLTEAALPADITFGLLKIVFSDGVNDLAPGVITFGQAGPAANPGIESLPFLNSASTPNVWNFTRAGGIAPAGTVQVSFFALFVDQSPGTGYFDDLAAVVPEPTSAGLALLGLVGLGLRRRR